MYSNEVSDCLGNRLRSIAQRVRGAVIGPTGRASEVCYEAAELIAVLIRKELDVWAESKRGYVLVDEGHLQHHWTECCDLLIDITIDQLGSDWPAVLIVPRSSPAVACYIEDFDAAMEHLRKVIGPLE